MFIKAGEKQYELNTKLGTAKRIEGKFKLPITKIFENIETAHISELMDILYISAHAPGVTDPDFFAALDDNLDYTDIMSTVQEFVLRILFSGDDDAIARKLEKYPVPEDVKNQFREILGLPVVKIEKPIATTESLNPENLPG